MSSRSTVTLLGAYILFMLFAFARSVNDKHTDFKLHVKGDDDKFVPAEDHHEQPNCTSNDTECAHLTRFHVMHAEFDRVSGPYVLFVFVLSASLVKLVFHHFEKVAKFCPESCVLIILGLLVGGILTAIGADRHTFHLNAETFFLFMLPPIVLEAGYFMPTRAFFDNIGSVLTMAVFGTLFNTFTIGLSLYALKVWGLCLLEELTVVHCLVFSALISAVDPVAVLAVFEEIHVNHILHIVVFGESLLNDAVTVVLYHMFEAFANIDKAGDILLIDVFAGLLAFFVVSIGGTLIGILFGILGSLVTRFTTHVRVIEPIFVFVIAYMSYLTAEIFHLSGILAIVFCGMFMKPYVEENVSHKSRTTIKYFMKMLASISETIIFMFLGLSTIIAFTDATEGAFDPAFLVGTLVFCAVYRAIGVLFFCKILNAFRMQPLTGTDQFIIAYGGLRGAIAFALCITLEKETIPNKETMVIACLLVVYFTVFVQGMTIKKWVDWLHVAKEKEHTPTMLEEVHDVVADHLLCGVEDIAGHHGYHYLKDRLEQVDNEYLRPFLLRDHDKAHLHRRSSQLLHTWEKLSFKEAADIIITRRGSVAGLGMGSRRSSTASMDSWAGMQFKEGERTVEGESEPEDHGEEAERSEEDDKAGEEKEQLLTSKEAKVKFDIEHGPEDDRPHQGRDYQNRLQDPLLWDHVKNHLHGPQARWHKEVTRGGHHIDDRHEHHVHPRAKKHIRRMIHGHKKKHHKKHHKNHGAAAGGKGDTNGIEIDTPGAVPGQVPDVKFSVTNEEEANGYESSDEEGDKGTTAETAATPGDEKKEEEVKSPDQENPVA